MIKNSYVEILQKSGLVDVVNHNVLFGLLEKCELLKFSPGETIFLEGQNADGVFLIISGYVQIIVERNNATIVLAKLSPGNYFGEQALLEESARSAGARAYDQVEVLKIDKMQFLNVVKKRKETLTKHIEAGLSQTITRHIFSELPGIKNSIKESVERYQKIFQEGTVIFKEGDQPDGIYWILQGAADILKGNALIATLRVGAVFGELAVIKKCLRSATVKAREELKVLFIPKDIVLQFAKTEELEDYFSGFLRSYQLTQKRGLITQRVKFSEQAQLIIVTQYTLTDGCAFKAELNAVGRQFTLEKTAPHDPNPTSTFSYCDKINQREVQLNSENMICKLKQKGEAWPRLQVLIQQALDGKQFSHEQFQYFSSTGEVSKDVVSEAEISVKPQDDSKVICRCMKITQGQITHVVESGAQTFDSVKAQLGCATVCGTCKPQILELVGENSWSKAKLVKVIPLTSNIKSYRFTLKNQPLYPSKPGQHIFIRAQINDVWVERPYTLTSIAGDDFYEISVKKEQKGLFSTWIFEQANESSDFEITNPQGDTFWSEKNQSPVFCFVAGIGITPAIAILRYKLKIQSSAKLTIHLSVKDTSHNAFRKEIEKGDTFPDITVITKESSKQARLSKDEVSQIIEKNTQAQFFLCGPSKFNKTVKSYLLEEGVDENRIKLDYFEAQGDTPNSSIAFENAKKIPMAPNCLPLIGHVLEPGRFPIFPYILKHYKQWGGIQKLKFLWKNLTIVTDPKLILILGDRPELFTNSTTLCVFKKAFQSKRALIAQEGPKHDCVRQAIEPAFEQSRINSDSIARIILAADRYTSRLKAGSFLDIHDLTKLTIMATCSLVHDEVPSIKLASLGLHLHVAMNTSYSTFFPFTSLFWMPQNYFFKKRFYQIVQEITQSEQSRSQMLKYLKEKVDFDNISFAKKEEVIRMVYMIPFLIGMFPVSTYVIMGLFAIHQEKELLYACRNEAKTFLSETSEKHSTQMLNHILAVVLECLRRFPTLPGLPVTTTRNCVIGDYKVPRGEHLLFATPITNFSEELYENPFEFKWQRYLINPNDHLFPKGTFGYGTHACIAKSISYEIISILIAYFLNHFEFELQFKDFKLSKTMRTIIQKKAIKIVRKLK